MRLPKKISDQLSYQYPGDRFVKRNKYSSRSCTCGLGHIHQSILEADYCGELSLLKKAREIVDFKIQHKIEIYIKGVHICNHIVDFLVLKPGGKREFHESKGYETDTWKIKRRLVEVLNPSIPYIVKYQKPNFFKGSI